MKLLMLVGLAATAFFERPAMIVIAANTIHPGPTPAWRQMLFDMSWQSRNSGSSPRGQAQPLLQGPAR